MNIPKTHNNKPLIYAWPYHDATGQIIGYVARYQAPDGKKDIIPLFNQQDGQYKPGLNLNPRPLFNLHQIAASKSPVFITEGEKAAAALQGLGFATTTSLGGSKAANKADWMPLSGANSVYILPDNDEPGEEYAKTVYQCLAALKEPPAIKVVRLPELPPAGDVVDWLQIEVKGWDGYQSLTPSLAAELGEIFNCEIIPQAEPVPIAWQENSTDSAGVSFDGPPDELKATLPDVETLTPEMIPEPFRDWLADISYRMQTPLDFVGITAITVTSSLIGAGCSIKPKQLDGWEVICNLWGACIARPSILLKTPSMGEVIRLLDKLQAEYTQTFNQTKNEADFDALQNESMLQDVKKKIGQMAKGSGKDGVVKQDDMATLKASYLELVQDSENKPVCRLFKTNETSIQAMTELQNQNPRGLLVFRDELTGLLTRWERDDCQDERAYYLEGFNGDGSYTDSKIGRGITHAENICISLLGGIQPDKLNRYLQQTLDGGNDGMVQRLQLAVYPDEPNPNAWQNVDAWPDKDARNQAYDLFKKLAEMDFTEYGAETDDFNNRPYFRFNSAGQQVFNEWLERLQKQKIATEENPLMLEHLGKYRSLMPSLALIFHLINQADGKSNPGGIDEQSANMAAAWCDYLETHARRIYALGDNPEQAAALRLSAKIQSGQVSSPFTLRDIHRKGWHGLKDAETIHQALTRLCEDNWLCMIRKPRPPIGRPPAPEYFINPKIKQEEAPAPKQ